MGVGPTRDVKVVTSVTLYGESPKKPTTECLCIPGNKRDFSIGLKIKFAIQGLGFRATEPPKMEGTGISIRCWDSSHPRWRG